MLTLFNSSSHCNVFSKNGVKMISKDSILTYHTFENLKISRRTIIRLKELGFTHMSKIQSFSIPLQISGYDLFARGKTGSGKTLAFIVPMIEFSIVVTWKRNDGLLGLIISPTRELTLQSYNVLRDMLKYHQISFGVFMGGSNRKTEIERIEKGINLVVATPGRLLDHLNSSKFLKTANLQFLTIDEADRCLEIGFEQEITQILRMLPGTRQTVLFSATQSNKLNSLSKMSFKNVPIYINSDKNDKKKEIISVKHGFIISDIREKMISLISIIIRNTKKKIIIFFSTCAEVDFFNLLLKRIRLPIFSLHGKLKQTDRTLTFFMFCRASSGILLSTDISARGLDFPNINWIIQFSPPLDPKEYIHRVGRSCRGLENEGTSVLFLFPSEIGFLKYLSSQNIILSEYLVNKRNNKSLRVKICQIIENNKVIHELAIKSAKSFFSSYMNHSLKSIFNVSNIKFQNLLSGYGLRTKKLKSFASYL